MFGALAHFCDEFFVSTLDHIFERFRIKPDVTGVTIMAIGSSSPELFTSLTGVFVAQDDVALGAIVVGSTLFNSLLVVGICVIVAPREPMNLDVHSVMRWQWCVGIEKSLATML